MKTERGEFIDEFETSIDDNGRILVPSALVQKFAEKKIHVRLSSYEIVAELKARGISESEIDSIGRMQREPRENVLKFLQSEGALKGRTSFSRRARA